MASAVLFFIVLLVLPIPSVTSFTTELKRVDNINILQLGMIIESALFPGEGDYVMKVWIGSPPMEASVIMEAGSELMWLQCTPCEECYPQQLPIFDPTRSTTHEDLPCRSSSCTYNYTDDDSSEKIGVMAKDTFIFPSTNNQPEAFTNMVFGCGHMNHGTFPPEASGIFGLGRGKAFFVSQMSSKVEKKFSYCLEERTASTTSLFRIGKYASLSNDKYVSTPLVAKKTHPNFYYLVPEGISFEGIEITNEKTPPKEGNMIIDSGTTLTYLDPNLYLTLEGLVKERIPLQPEEYPPPGYRICYEGNIFGYFIAWGLIFLWL